MSWDESDRYYIDRCKQQIQAGEISRALLTLELILVCANFPGRRGRFCAEKFEHLRRGIIAKSGDLAYDDVVEMLSLKQHLNDQEYWKQIKEAARNAERKRELREDAHSS